MGPYYDHIIMITLGHEPVAPSRPSFEFLGGKLRAIRRIAAGIWNRVKPRYLDDLALAPIPAGGDWESPQHGRADRFDPLLR